MEGASSYNVYWEEAPTGRSSSRVTDCSGDRMEGVTGTSYTHTGLNNGASYRYRVTAVGGNGQEGSCGNGEGGSGENTGDGVTSVTPGVTPTPTPTPRPTNPTPVPTPTPTPVPGDTTPPTTTVALAEASKTSTTWTGSATINEAGTGYCTTVTNGSPAPTAAEVKADTGTGHSGTGGSVAMTANTTANCTVTGLLPGVAYDFYFVAEDVSANLQTTANVSGPVLATTPVSATVTTQMVHGVSTDTIAWLVAKTDTNSSGYCVAVPQGSAAPTVAQIAAGTGGAIVGTKGTVALTANTSGFCTVTGLTASTPYDLYFVAEDAGHLYQGAASSALNKSTTAAQGAPPGAPGEMVAVLGGCFMMGDNFAEGWADELPVHPVCLSSYFMDATEVTQAAYGNNPNGGYGFDAAADCGGLATTCPAEMLNWQQASDYCTAVANRRLPTEAEWEYAARERGLIKRPGTLTDVRYGTGTDAIDCTTANGWLGAGGANPCVGAGATAAVGSYAPNALGLYDMSGNVWEWVSDWRDATYYASSPITNPPGGAGANRVLRGGSWNYFSDNLRASVRNSSNPTTRGDIIGFRCSSM